MIICCRAILDPKNKRFGYFLSTKQNSLVIPVIVFPDSNTKNGLKFQNLENHKKKTFTAEYIYRLKLYSFACADPIYRLDDVNYLPIICTWFLPMIGSKEKIGIHLTLTSRFSHWQTIFSFSNCKNECVCKWLEIHSIQDGKLQICCSSECVKVSDRVIYGETMFR